MSLKPETSTILIRGANDVASAVAHVLFNAGYVVALHEVPQPTTARRGMSFTDAAYDGSAVLEHVTAQLVELPAIADVLAARKNIPFCVADFSALLGTLRPEILIDARMRKHHQPEVQRGLAPLTIGLGPNFKIGETVDLGIETGWDLAGEIVRHGTTAPLAGEPRSIEGHARERYVYAPVGGIFHTEKKIGSGVQTGEEIARIDSAPLLAPIGGVLRGLTRTGIPVQPKTKVIEVDPREVGAQASGIGERPARIAQGVLQAVRDWQV